jgi:hypothetical protein
MHPSAQNASPANQCSASDVVAPRRAQAGSDRACCCPAQAVVEVIMPATEARPYEADLLLCGHHFRASRRALTDARAVIVELPGTDPDTAAWIGLSRSPQDVRDLSPGSP